MDNILCIEVMQRWRRGAISKDDDRCYCGSFDRRHEIKLHTNELMNYKVKPNEVDIDIELDR